MTTLSDKMHMPTPTPDDIMKTIAENLPSLYALDDVWTGNGTVFDLGSANADSVEQWRLLAAAVLDLWKCHGCPAHPIAPGDQPPSIWPSPGHSDQGLQQLPGNWPRLGIALTSFDQEGSSPAENP